jgi:hypothetical protein
VLVFDGPTDFDKMVDELVNRYYMEGEHWLMKRGVKAALCVRGDTEEGMGLDECFFVLQRCSQRAVATNNIHAACAVLHLISDLISSDLLEQSSELLSAAASKAAPIMQDHLARFRGGAGGSSESSSGSLSKGLKSAMSLVTGAGGVAVAPATDDHEEVERNEDDPYGLAAVLDVFNTAEMCMRYTERLGRDVAKSGENVFGTPTTPAPAPAPAPAHAHAHAHGAEAKRAATKGASSGLSPEMEKLKLCKEDFDSAQAAFQHSLKGGAEKIVAIAQGLMKDILTASLGRTGPLGGVKFDLDDERFDAQPAVGLLPKLLVTPFEMLLGMSTSGLSEGNKDLMVGLLADACCERLEQYITTVRAGDRGCCRGG